MQVLGREYADEADEGCDESHSVGASTEAGEDDLLDRAETVVTAKRQEGRKTARQRSASESGTETTPSPQRQTAHLISYLVVQADEAVDLSNLA